MKRTFIRHLVLPGIALMMAGPALITAPVMAAASGRVSETLRPAPYSVGASHLTLAQAPIGLQVAVLSALGVAGGSSQQARLTASDGAAQNRFGVSVAIDAFTAVVGAPGRNSYTGATYVFVRSGTTWTQQAELTASDAASGNYFGGSVAIFGSTALVGAPQRNSATGAAYVFVRSGTSWSQVVELTASDGASTDYFGSSVAFYRSTALVGAYSKNSQAGAAYVFVRSGTTWTEQAKLTASDGAFGDWFGASVAVLDSTAVVGAPSGYSKPGAAYLFVRSGTTWTQQAKLSASDAVPGDFFGFSVAISGSTTVVGAPRKNSWAGTAYVFVRSGTTWSQQAKFASSQSDANDQFGFSVAIFGATAVVGSPFEGKNSSTGTAYVFVRSGTTWSQPAKFAASNSAANDEFGFSVATAGSTVVVGAWGKNSQTGAAYVYLLR